MSYKDNNIAWAWWNRPQYNCNIKNEIGCWSGWEYIYTAECSWGKNYSTRHKYSARKISKFLFMHCVKNAFQICNINIFIIMLLACHFMTFHTIPLDIYPLLNEGRYWTCTQGTCYSIWYKSQLISSYHAVSVCFINIKTASKVLFLDACSYTISTQLA